MDFIHCCNSSLIVLEWQTYCILIAITGWICYNRDITDKESKMKQIINYGCDGQGDGNCTAEDSEIRVLPFGNGNLLLCRNHWTKEFIYRGERNRNEFPPEKIQIGELTIETPNPEAFERKIWNDLEIYDPE